MRAWQTVEVIQPMTQLEKAREEIRGNTILIAFDTTRVDIYCEECDNTGHRVSKNGLLYPCFACNPPDED